MVKNFDLAGWICFSERRNSKSYVSPDKKWMAKFGTKFAEMTLETLENEIEITKKALAIGVKTPKVNDIVQLTNGEVGIIYEYIEGKKSIARATGEDIENYDKYMKRFAHIARDLHSKVCEQNEFESYEDRVRTEILRLDLFNEYQKEKALKLLDGIEKRNTCVHGDFQTGNFIITEKEEYVIDLGTIAYGNPEYDVASFYFFTHYFPPYVTERIFHCKEKYLDPMWRSFVRYYYDINEEKAINEITKKIAKNAIVCFFGILKFVDPGKEMKPIIEKYFDKEYE